jgi:hypothetical protein
VPHSCTVKSQALVAFRGNFCSAPPALNGAQVQVRHRLGTDELRIVTARGATVATHHSAPDGASRVIRDEGHMVALEHAAITAFSRKRPRTHKTADGPRRRPWPKQQSCSTPTRPPRQGPRLTS